MKGSMLGVAVIFLFLSGITAFTHHQGSSIRLRTHVKKLSCRLETPTRQLCSQLYAGEGSNSDGDIGSDDQMTTVGSKEYYQGFFSSPLKDESVASSSRGDGVEQALKLGGSAMLFLTALTLAFLKSNNVF
jgi:hypothetical protein